MTDKTIWTRFYNMSFGGSSKLDSDVIWIEATEEEAVKLFEQIFKRDPYNVTCECCGEDYSIYEKEFNPKLNDWIVSKENIDDFKNHGKLLTQTFKL